MTGSLPTYDDVISAYILIEPYINRTPVLASQTLNEMTGAELYFKCENFQKVGAFKFRGACNAVFSLPEQDVTRGVATHSSGNHAAALALAARLRKIPAYIVMPENSAEIKKKAVAGYGGKITYCVPTLQGREEGLKNVVAETGATFVHAYNNPHVISGQGSAALEMLNEIVNLDVILAPVGGGGLLSGTATYAKGFNPKIRVIGVEPEIADDAYRSFTTGELVGTQNTNTIADGLRTALGDLTFAVIRKRVDDIVTVSEESIARAMRTVWERMKLVIEPSSAVPVAALLDGKIDAAGKRIGVILSGGNVDLENLPF